MIKIIVKAEKEVAYTSPDHLMPWGTRRDNSTNRHFNNKLYSLYSDNKEPLKILDMGCSGGGFVKNCLDDGCLAVGLEGSDFSKRNRRAEWRTIPEFLFTADITADFEVLAETEALPRRLQFDAVTSWEVMEHIAEPDIAKVAANVKRHLVPSGIWIMSVSPKEEVINGVRLHQTVQQKDWWIKKFAELGLHHEEEYVSYFNTQFVRGPKYGSPDAFHLVVTMDWTKRPAIPKESLLRRLYDCWLGSVPQRILTGTY